MRKKAPLAGERKNGKGEVASEQTPHPSACPPLAADRRRPFRCSSFSHTNRFAGFAREPCPLCNPLKTTKKGAAAPFLGSSPRLGLCGDRFRLAKRDTDAALTDRRGSRNTLRLFRSCFAWKLVCARYAAQPLPKGRPIDFHTSNIQRAQIERFVLRIVRLGNPILRPPEGRSLRDVSSVSGTQKQNAFSARKRYFASPASLFCILFSDKPEKSMSAKRILRHVAHALKQSAGS